MAKRKRNESLQQLVNDSKQLELLMSIVSISAPSSLPNVFPPLRDMSLVPDEENDHHENQYKPAPRPVSIDKRNNHNSNQRRVESWLDEAEFEPDGKVLIYSIDTIYN